MAGLGGGLMQEGRTAVDGIQRSLGVLIEQNAQLLLQMENAFGTMYDRAADYAPYQDLKGGETDADGNLALPLYTVPLGYTAHLVRATVEAAGYTPAAPYSTAGWIGLFEADAGSDVGALGSGAQLGQLVTFGPTVVGGGWLPGVFSMGESHAWVFQPGATILLLVSEGPASTPITARFRANVEKG